MSTRSLAITLLLASFVIPAGAQPPLQLNTVLRGHVLVPSSPWVAECQAFTDSLGRDFVLQCRGHTGFTIYEITDPANPVQCSHIGATTSDLKDVTTKGNTAYLTQQGGDVLVVDITDPYNASVVNTISVSSGHNGNAQGNVFALTGTSGSLRLYDISTPTSPVFMSQYNALGMTSTHDAELDENGTKLYAHTFANSTTRILDVSNPAAPTQLGVIPYGNHSGVTIHRPGGQIVHGAMRESAGGHIRFYDVTNPAAPAFLSSYQPPTAVNGSIHNAIAVDDRWVAIAYYNDYLRILDMANPTNPVEVGIFDPNPNNIGVSLFGGAWSCDHVRTFGNGTQRYVVTEMYAPNAGFYIVDFTGANTIDVTATTTGVGDGMFSVAGIDANTDFYNLFSVDTGGTVGTGPIAGIGPDALSQLFNPPGTPFFHPFADPSGNYALSFGPGALPVGATFDLVTFGRLNGSWESSAVTRITF